MKLSVQPRGFRQLPEGINRPGEFPVDERDRDAALGDDVPRTRITMTEHRMTAGQQTGERRLPARVRWRLEGLRSIVQPAHERAKGADGMVIPGSRMRRRPGDIGDHFPAIGAETVTDGDGARPRSRPPPGAEAAPSPNGSTVQPYAEPRPGAGGPWMRPRRFPRWQRAFHRCSRPQPASEGGRRPSRFPYGQIRSGRSRRPGATLGATGANDFPGIRARMDNGLERVRGHGLI